MIIMGRTSPRKIITDIHVTDEVAVGAVCIFVYLVVLGITLSSETLASAIEFDAVY